MAFEVSFDGAFLVIKKRRLFTESVSNAEISSPEACKNVRDANKAPRKASSSTISLSSFCALRKRQSVS